MVADVDDAGGGAVAAELGDRGVFVPLDVADEQQWAGAVERPLAAFGRVDVLVNNAGRRVPAAPASRTRIPTSTTG